jgi:hypothetical protein
MTMRVSIVLSVLLLLSVAAFADDVSLTLNKAGGCSGSITVTDRDTRRVIASCGLTCGEKTVTVPAGTWVRISTRAATRCSGGMADMSLCANRLGACELQVGPEGSLVTARFAWNWNSRL